jgi:hypothetical protein
MSLGAAKEQVVAVAMRGQAAGDVFEKDGMIWIGDLGLKFNSEGVLVDARPAVDPF